MIRLFIISAVFVLSLAMQSNGQDRKAAGAARPDIPVTITDREGKTVRPESLKAADQAKLDKVKRAAESVAAGEPGGTAQRVNITISCTYPPLKCTITISW